VGVRRKTYNVLTGSVLSVWTAVESILSSDGQKKGQHAKMQVRAEAVKNLSVIAGRVSPISV
jgi:hypothetical protein